MNLQERLMADLKSAMKSSQKEALLTLRAITANLQNKRLEKKAKGQEEPLSDEEVLAVLMSEAKKRKESISAYEGAGREELADAEKLELEIIQKYLPQQLSEAELRKEIDSIFENNKPQDIGQAMGLVMPKLRTKADSKLISQIVKEKLS